MNMLLSIKLSDMVKHFGESKKAAERRCTYDQQCEGIKNEPPGIWLVKDEGAYIMSNAQKRDLEVSYIYASEDGKNFRLVKNNWELQQAIDGDDFVQFLDEDFITAARQNVYKGHVYIEFTEESFGIVRWD